MKFGRGVQFAGVLTAAALMLSVAGCDRVQQSPATSGQSGSLGAGVDDTILSAKVSAALLADLSSRSYGLSVEVRQGHVRLSGHAQSRADIDRAVEVVRKVNGVKTVENHAEVKPVDQSVGDRVDDGIITARIKTALLADKSVKGLGIGVATNKGEVQLSGFVDAPAESERAGEIARSVEGVRAVDNQIQVRK